MTPPNRSGTLDMFVLYIDDAVAKGCETKKQRTINLITILTCETYLLFDDRSETERARENIICVVNRIFAMACDECNDFIDRLIAQKNKTGLEILYSRLANNVCRQRVYKILHTVQGENDAPITI